MPTKIEWTEETWNPVTGCTKVSTGCRNCYAERMAHRLAGRFGYPPAPDQFKVTLHFDRLNEPFSWKKPRKVFVCSMGDLFHEDVPERFIDLVFDRIFSDRAAHHIFQILTKRPQRMFEYISGLDYPWPADNLWLGVTAENQEAADERIPLLLKTPAAVRFVSVEPMLGPITLNYLQHRMEYEVDALNGTCGILRPHVGTCEHLDWVICGGETGAHARQLKWEWVEDLVKQCREANVPFFFKRVGDKFDGMDLLKAEALAWNRQWPKVVADATN